jgi:hypothetical protein
MTPRSFAAALLAIAGLVLVPGPARPASARAEDAPAAKPQDLWTARSPDVARSAAAKLWKSGEDAKTAQLFECAVRVARQVVLLDPDHKAARAVLGQSKKDDGWADDPSLAAKAPRRNFPAKPVGLEEGAAIERKWRKDFLAARAAAAGVWASFGDECAKKSDAKSAEQAWRRALETDPDQPRARAALGYFRWQGAWFTEPQVRAVEEASKASVVDGPSPLDAVLAATLVKVETPHFRIESRIPADRLKEIARWLETGYAIHLSELGMDPTANLFATPVRFVLCDSDADWSRWLDGFVRQNKEFMRTLDGCWADPTPAKEHGLDRVYGMKPPADGDDETRRDHVLHRAIHAINQSALGIFWPHWADEGLAHVATIRVQTMTRTWCLGPNKSEYAKLEQKDGKAGWIDESEWRRTVRAAVLSHDDLPLRTLVLKKFDELGFAGTLKAWSTLDWWRNEDPDSLRSLLGKFRGQKPEDSAKAIEEHFGKALEDLDEDWRRWVLRTY